MRERGDAARRPSLLEQVPEGDYHSRPDVLRRGMRRARPRRERLLAWVAWCWRGRCGDCRGDGFSVFDTDDGFIHGIDDPCVHCGGTGLRKKE